MVSLGGAARRRGTSGIAGWSASDRAGFPDCRGMQRGMALGKARPHQPGSARRDRRLSHFFDALVSASWLAPRAVAIAAQLDHPVYEGLYLALAKAEQAELVTADTQLVGKVRVTSWEQRTVSLSEYKLSS